MDHHDLEILARGLGVHMRRARDLLTTDAQRRQAREVKSTQAQLAARSDGREVELHVMTTREYVARYAMGEMDA